jgi:hypothetical protein
MAFRAAAEQESFSSLPNPAAGEPNKKRPPEGHRFAEGNRRYFLTWPDWISPDHLPVGAGRCSMNCLKRLRSSSTRRGVASTS